MGIVSEPKSVGQLQGVHELHTVVCQICGGSLFWEVGPWPLSDLQEHVQ